MRRLACVTFATLCVSAANLGGQQPTAALCGGPSRPLAGRYWTSSGSSRLELRPNGTFTLELPKDKTFGRWEVTGPRDAPLVFYVGERQTRLACACKYGADSEAPSSTWMELISSTGSVVDDRWYHRPER